MSDTRNYRLVYPDPRTNEKEPSGGYVEVHDSHNEGEVELNVLTAIILAKLGYQIRLLLVDNTPNRKNPDAFLIREGVKLSSNTISNRLRLLLKKQFATHIGRLTMC